MQGIITLYLFVDIFDNRKRNNINAFLSTIVEINALILFLLLFIG